MRTKKTIFRPGVDLGKEQGFLLITTYLIVALVAVFSIAFFARSNAFVQAAERNQNSIIAFNMAEAGIDFALTQLTADSNYAGTSEYVPMDTDFVRGGFTVTVTQAENNPDVRIIQATGFAPNNDNASRAYQAAAITAYGEYGRGHLFDFGVFAQNNITLAGNAFVDSYDSRNGVYGDGNEGNNGDIGTNSVASNAVSLTGNATINGDAVIGPNGDPAAAISLSKNSTITGAQSAAASETTYAAPSTNVASSGDLEISGKTTHYLMPGTYRFDSLKITGNGVLQPTGAVTIYVDGDIDIGGNGIATSNNLPTNCIIYATGSSDVKISGNGSLYAGIYAPLADVKNSGNGSIYGAVVAQNYTQTGNGNVHFDEALKEVEGSNRTRMSIKAWGEQNSLTWGTGVETVTEAESV